MTTQPIHQWELDWTFGDRLRKARRVLGLTVEALATTLDVSKQVVSQWENGVSNPRSINAIARRLELAYGIPAWWLLGQQEPPTGRPGEGNEGEVLPRLDLNQEPSGLTHGLVIDMFTRERIAS